MDPLLEQHGEPIMKALKLALAALAVLAGLMTAVPAFAHGGVYYGGRGYWYGPSVRFYYGGGPYWGWGAPYYYGPGYGYGVGYGYWPPAYVYGPPAVVTSTAGVVYIERSPGTVSTQQAAPEAAPPPPPAAAPAAPPGAQWWYLCSNPRGAYPYVRECPGGWERVPAVPPGPSR
jgi:hypothetical protein